MEYIFMFDSTNSAIQSEQKLLSSGVKATVMPTPSDIKAGCGICICVNDIDLSESKVLLRGLYTNIYNKKGRVYKLIEEGDGQIFTTE